MEMPLRVDQAGLAGAMRRCEDELRAARDDGEALEFCWLPDAADAPSSWRLRVRTPRLRRFVPAGYRITVTASSVSNSSHVSDLSCLSRGLVYLAASLWSGRRLVSQLRRKILPFRDRKCGCPGLPPAVVGPNGQRRFPDRTTRLGHPCPGRWRTSG
jgi:hypothetical protein